MAQERHGIVSPNTLTILGGDVLDERLCDRPPRPPSSGSMGSSRPATGRKSAARTQSSLEILPPEDNNRKSTSKDKQTTRNKQSPNDKSAANRRSSSLDSKSKTKSVSSSNTSSSSGFYDDNSNTATKTTTSTSRPGSVQRCSSTGSIDDLSGSRTPTRQVILPTVKRNFEQYGMPKDEALAQSLISPSRSSLYDSNGGMDSQGNVMSPFNDYDDELRPSSSHRSSDKDNRPSSRNKSGRKERHKDGSGSTTEVDSYYLSHNTNQLKQNKDDRHKETEFTVSAPSSNNITATKPIHDRRKEKERERNGRTKKPTPAKVDSGSTETETNNVEAGPSSKTQKDEEKVNDATEETKEESESEDSSSSDDDTSDEEEEIKAPLELMGEFIESVMQEDWDVALKLCQMIQMYEPENPECLEFKPLIEEMLKREREYELWGTDDEEEGEEGEEGEEDEGEEEDEDEEDEDEDEDEDDSSSSSSSSSCEDDDDDDDDDEDEDEDDEAEAEGGTEENGTEDPTGEDTAGDAADEEEGEGEEETEEEEAEVDDEENGTVEPTEEYNMV